MCILFSQKYSNAILEITHARAVSGISGSRVPDNRLGYPNPNFGSGTRNVALWEESKDYFTHKNVRIRTVLDVSDIESLLNMFSMKLYQ